MSGVLLIQTSMDAEDALARFRNGDRCLAFDTETTGPQVRSPHHDKGRTIQFSWRPWVEAVVFEMTDRWKPAIAEFFDTASQLLAHNLKFDAHVVDTYLGRSLWDTHPVEAFHDTVWVARLHDERDKASLKPMAVRYLNDEAADEQGKLKRLMARHGWGWATVPVEHLVEYGGQDAILTGRLFDLLFPRITYALDAYHREQRLAPVLYRMERSGLLVDRALLEEVSLREEAAMRDAEAAVHALAPAVNVNAPAQLLGAFRERGVPVEDTTAATLRRVVSETGDALAAAVLDYRNHAKTLGTYAQPWLELLTPEGRLHPSFNSLGASTGRMSSDHPNFQNIKRGHLLRDAFIAAPGASMVVADWNQMELRLYAHFARDASMRSAFIAGEDIYQQVADLLGVPRQVGKMMMLAAIYGAGPKTIARQVVAMAYAHGNDDLIPLLRTFDWEELHGRFHRAYAIRDLARLTELAARRRGYLGDAYILTLGGRRQRPKAINLPAVNGHRQTVYLYKDLANALVQGSSADLMKEALISVDAQGAGQYLRLTVHDEMVLEVPDSEVEEVERVVRRAMYRPEFIPPLTIGISSAKRYGEAK